MKYLLIHAENAIKTADHAYAPGQNAEDLRRLKPTMTARFYSFFVCIPQTMRHQIPQRGINLFSAFAVPFMAFSALRKWMRELADHQTRQRFDRVHDIVGDIRNLIEVFG